MTQAELVRAITVPAEKQGRVLESGLVDRILADVGEQPGTLPLLQFALQSLWERQQEGWLIHTGYDAIGGVEGALARYADGVYGSLPPPDQTMARRVFVQLVQPGEGTEDTRRVAVHGEMTHAAWGLVQSLADAHLIVTGRDASGSETAELVHEALIRHWDDLRGWMESNRVFRTWQERLRYAIRQWEASRNGGIKCARSI